MLLLYKHKQTNRKMSICLVWTYYKYWLILFKRAADTFNTIFKWEGANLWKNPRRKVTSLNYGHSIKAALALMRSSTLLLYKEICPCPARNSPVIIMSFWSKRSQSSQHSTKTIDTILTLSYLLSITVKNLKRNIPSNSKPDLNRASWNTQPIKL